MIKAPRYLIQKECQGFCDSYWKNTTSVNCFFYNRMITFMSNEIRKVRNMGPIALAGTFLCVELGTFSIADYVLSKTLDIGTGKLWPEIKKRFNHDRENAESMLYDAIEVSVRKYSELNDQDHVAQACEMIYATWIVEGGLSEEQVKKALAQVNSRYIAQRNIQLWYSLFYQEIAKKEFLYRWFMMHTAKGLGERRSRNDEVLEQIKEILERSPKEEHIKIQGKRAEYEKWLKGQILQPVLGESFCLRDIYVSLHGKSGKRNILQNVPPVIVDTTSYIWDWFRRKESRLLFLYGEPGSGKSSIVKMAAATLTASAENRGMVVFIDLHRLSFSEKESALKVVKSYIEEKFPWFFKEGWEEKRLLILDGLDEIKYKVYESAVELVRELESCDWAFPCKVIVSGRTQIILKSMEDIRGEELEILPLYLDEDDLPKQLSKAADPDGLLQEDLRQGYWNTLMGYFQITQEMPVLNSRFDELSKSPLLLFLVVWTIKHAGIQFAELKNAAELYDNIFRYIYTREYNRTSSEIYFKSREYLEYQQMLHDLGGCAFRNNSRSIPISAIYEYCTRMGREELCQRWIQKHKEDNPSKLVLFFFLREIQHEMDWNQSEIEFIHKTFYEYLAAVAIIEFLYYQTREPDNGKFLPLLFFLFSKNAMGGEITRFISEIVQNESLVIGGEPVTLEHFRKILSDMLSWGFNVNYPIAISSEDAGGENINVESYSALVQTVAVYEENIKAVLEVLTGMEAVETEERAVDLSCMGLQKVQIPWWKFDGCLMDETHLDEAYLSGASFKNCSLRGATIMNVIADRAVFCNADLSDADFSGTQLATANFTEAILERTVFELAMLEGAYFCNTILDGTKFASADLTAANFDRTIIRGADFHGADLTRADFSNAELESADWENCIMDGALLYGVKLSQFDLDNPETIEMLSEADLSGADWTGVTDGQKQMLLGKEDGGE